MKVGDLVEQAPLNWQLPDEPYHGKIGIVVELEAPADVFDTEPTVWVQWQGNSDWDIESEAYLTVVSL